MPEAPGSYRVVLDTSVLISALRSQGGASFRLLQLVGDPRWHLSVSTALMFEYEAVARREAANFWASPEKIEDVLDFLCAQADRPRISYAWRPTLADPDDDMVLELAVAAQAHYIVTHNVRHFRRAEPFGVGILTPREFLQKLGDIL